jgi:hypothetical protein
MEKKDSIFAGLTPAPPPAQFRAPEQERVPRVQASPESEAKIAGLEAAVKTLKAEIAALNAAVTRPAPPVKPDKELLARLDRSEAGLLQLKTIVSECQFKVEECLEKAVSKDDIAAVNFSVSDVVSSFEAMKRRLSDYAAEFSGVEHECRKYIGELRGYVKNIDQKLVAERFDEYLKNSVSRQSAKLAEVETAMHTGLADLSSRLMSDEVLYGKIFAESEERIKKGMEPDMQEVSGQVKNLREKVTWLMDEYNIVMERKMRALEAKYSAFDALAVRMDTITEAILPDGNAGTGGRSPGK